jgi:hypothetical protein
MNQQRYGILTLALGMFVHSAVNAESCVYGDAKAPVLIYTEAMKEYRFDDAYAVLTKHMTDGLAVDAWAAGQRKLFELGQVVIGKLDVRWPQHIDSSSCNERALVPNVLSAKDRFNNQGSVEFELYTVVNEGGTWKIDAQETLIDEEAIHRRFPGDAIPDFKDQLPNEDVLPGDDVL